MSKSEWTLFLDRDGVINTELPADYVKSWDEFRFEVNALEALVILRDYFGKMIIVTNQRGVGAGLMTQEDLDAIHGKMLEIMKSYGIQIDAIYAVTDVDRGSIRRKPYPYMGHCAKQDFPDIDFSKSLIAGNSFSDMEFGHALGIKTAYIDEKRKYISESKVPFADFKTDSLYELARRIKDGHFQLH